jgi:hypothetical protein
LAPIEALVTANTEALDLASELKQAPALIDGLPASARLPAAGRAETGLAARDRAWGFPDLAELTLRQPNLR